MLAQAGSQEASPPAQFGQQFDRAVASCYSPDDVLNVAARLLRQHSASFVGRYRPAGTRIGEPQQLDGLTAPAEGLDTTLRTRITECCAAAVDSSRQGNAVTESGLCIHAAPYQAQPREVLVAVTDRGADSAGAVPLMLSLVAARLSEKHLQHQVHAAERGSRHAAALVELMAHLDQCRDIEDGAGRLGRELQRYLQADRVMVGYCEDEDASCSLVADTTQNTIDRHSEETRLIQAVLEESAGRKSASLWPPHDRENRHALQAHEQLVDRLQCRAVTASPLTTEKGQTIGAIVVTYGLTSVNDDLTANTESAADILGTADSHAAILARRTWTFLAAASAPIAATLMLLDRSAPGPGSYFKRLWRHAFTSQRRRTIGVIAAALTAIMLLPLHYRIDCEAELQPVWRRFVATPFDGTLQECLVRPGEYVERGTLLALMDEREINWELAGIQADMSRARKEHNSHLAEHNSGDAAIARHEVDRLQHRSDLLTFRSENLELRSPIDGIVVSGDHRDEEGVPLKTGDTLFEIAPLDLMFVEIAVPEEDIRWVREGMPVRLQLNAMPAKLIDATVSRVYPRAELKDHDNVFIVEAEISNSDGLLRPGMRGNVQIISDRHTLGWNLLHKPTAWLVGWLGW